MRNNHPGRIIVSSAKTRSDQASWLSAKAKHYFQSLKRYVLNHRRLRMYILGRFQIIRNLTIQFPSSVDLLPVSSSRIITREAIDAIVNNLHDHGYAPELYLSKITVAEILDFAHSHPFFDNQNNQKIFTYQELQQPLARDRHQVLIGRYADTAQDCPAIMALQQDPTLQAIATKYLGRAPGHSDHRLWWSLANNTPDKHARVRSGQEFHYDLDDYRTLSFFFYLTDVDTLSGPLMFIRGSHKKKKLQYIFSLFKARTEANLLKFYHPDDFIELCGSAGFGFAVDLFGYHRGKPPSQRDRLIVQIRFALNNYNPPGEALDGFQGGG
jgi:hypothetical protein